MVDLEMVDLKPARLASALLPALALAAVGLVACDGKSASGISGFSGKTPTAAGASGVAHRPASSNPGAEMVSAVPAGKGSTSLNLKFDIKSRPSVGEPVDIDVDLTPSSEFDRLQVVFRANEGLEIRSGATSPPVDKPPIDTPLHFTLTVVPRSEGIFSISAVVLSDSPDGSISRTYAIPVIAGAGIAAPDAASDAAGVSGASGADAARPAS